MLNIFYKIRTIFTDGQPVEFHAIGYNLPIKKLRLQVASSEAVILLYSPNDQSTITDILALVPTILTVLGILSFILV